MILDERLKVHAIAKAAKISEKMVYEELCTGWGRAYFRETGARYSGCGRVGKRTRSRCLALSFQYIGRIS